MPPRPKIRRALRVLTVDGRTVDCLGETHNIDVGGVTFAVASELPAGETIVYEITLSDCGPAARIRCGGVILRCAPDGDAWRASATMQGYVFISSNETDSIVASGIRAPAPGDVPPAQLVRATVTRANGSAVSHLQEFCINH